MKKRVYITFPVAPAHPFLHKGVVNVSWRLLHDRRYDLHLCMPCHNPFENNLHHCVKEFVEGRFDYWLSIDADNPPMRNPLDLVGLDLDIVGLPTPVWHCAGDMPGERPYYWNGYDYVPEKDAYREHEGKQGLQLVDAIGTGCFMVARRVFECPDMRKAPFERKLNPDGTVNKGNDISFCERARANGFNIWCHYDYPCQHFVNVELHETAGAFHSLYTSGEGVMADG